MKKILPLLLLLLASLGLFAQTIYYVKTTGSDANSGTSWGHAFRTVKKALATASSGQVWVAAGTYYPDEGPGTTNNDPTSAFSLKNNVAVYGGFAGTEATLQQRNPDVYPTTLSGYIEQANGGSGHAYNVFRNTSVNNTAVLDGFTITGGYATLDAAPYNAGGAMYNSNSSPIIAHCNFSANMCGYQYQWEGDCTRGGGAMYNFRSSPTITQCTFTGNWTRDFGGAIANNEASSPTITLCTFRGNICAFGAYGGGALHNFDRSSPTISSCLFISNSSDWFGGAISNGSFSSPAITNCTFWGNRADYLGGTIYNDGSYPKLTNCILWDNADAGNGHQTILDHYSSTTVNYSIIQGGWGAGTGNLNTDPLFRAPGSGNFRLQCQSPAIDAGDNTAVPQAVTTDLDGLPRVGNNRVDMGAYEIQGVLYVKANATGLNDGSSWANAFTKLQDALAQAMCSQVWVAGGTYYPDEGVGLTNNDRTLSFALKNGVSIYGGFDGTESWLFMRNADLHPTILSGDIDGLSGTSGNAYHVVTATSVDSTAILDGFTISDGNATATNNSYGGGMYNTAASPTVVNCTFKNNAAAAGGAVFNQAASPTLTHCRFLNNRANSGGGIYNRSTTPTPSNSSPVISSCSFLSNIVTLEGGAIYNDAASGTVVNCVFWGNGAATGAGLFNQYTNILRIINCSFARNSASSSGGALYNWNNYTSQPTITNSILWGDTKGEITGDGATVTYSTVQGGYSGTNNGTEDPLFYNAASGDLHLQPCSPAIDAGNTAAVPPGITTDVDGAPRTVNALTDRGAYEFQGALYVKKDATGLNNGSSWTNAFTSLQDALAVPTGCPHLRMIWVAKGTYYPDEGAGQLNNDRSASFRLKKGIALYGGFAGTETSLSQRLPGSARYIETVLSGEIDGVTGNAGNSYHVVRSEGVDSSAVLDGFIITGGNANGSTAPNNGGGGLYNNSTPTIRYCLFNANIATNGGAVYNTAAASIINCRFTQNRAAYGGAIYNQSASPSILNGLFWKNTVPGQGGAIYDTAASPLIINGSFNGNAAAAGYGGALRNVAASAPVIINSILWGDNGGEISNAGSTPLVSYSIVQGGYSGEGNLDTDPLFWDATIGDLSLTNFPVPSPAIDAGNNEAVTLATDVYGGQRIYNNIVDMGADEYYPGGKGGPEPLVLTCPQDFTLQSSPGSCGAVAEYSGAHAATTTGGEPPVTLTYDPAPGTLLPLGDVWVTVTAKDAYRTLHCSFWITVVDTVPPVISNVTLDKPLLYPPNHQLQEVKVDYTVADSCAATMLSVSSNEAIHALGSGNTTPDWQIIDAHHVRLRAERSGKGSDRIYTITITAVDAAGNTSTAITTVTVPHDKGAVTVNEAAAGKEVNKLSIQAVPNPSSNGFTITTQSPSDLPVTIQVIDATGKVIERKERVTANGTLYLGSTYRPGVYYLQVQQGSVRQTLKLIKQSR